MISLAVIGYTGFSRFSNVLIDFIGRNDDTLMTLASIGTFGEPENPEQLENLEKPVTSSGIICTDIKPYRDSMAFSSARHPSSTS